MSMGRRVAREIKIADEKDILEQIITWLRHVNFQDQKYRAILAGIPAISRAFFTLKTWILAGMAKINGTSKHILILAYHLPTIFKNVIISGMCKEIQKK